MKRKNGRNTYSKRSIRRKLMAVLLVTGLVPLLIGAIVGTSRIVRALEESIGANFRELAVQTRDKTDLALNSEIESATCLGRTASTLIQETKNANARYGGKSESEILAEMERLDKQWIQAPDNADLIRQPLESKASSRLNSHLATGPDKYAEILLTDGQGALIGATERSSDYYQADEEWWQKAFNNGDGAVYVSQLNYDESAGVISLDICVPVMDEKRRHAIGVLKIVVSAGPFLNALTEIHPGKASHVLLVSSGGDILVGKEGLLQNDKLSADTLARLDPSRASWYVSSGETYKHEEEGAIVGVAPLRSMESVSPGSFGGERWYILVDQATSEAFAPVRHLIVVLALIGGGMVIAIILVGFWIADRIAQPIKALHEGAELIGSGRWDHRLEIKTGDEIEQLADEFNRMADKLGAYHESLERQVAERTAELANKVTQLERSGKHQNMIIESSPVPMIMVNSKREIIEINDAALAVIEGKRERIIGKVCHELLCPGTICPMLDRGETINHSERAVLNSRGEEIPTLKSAVPIEIEGETILLEAFVDIREQKQVEKDLRQAHAQNELLLRSISSIMIAADERGKITQWNHAAQIAFGTPAEDTIGSPFAELDIDWDFKTILDAVAKCMDTAKPTRANDVRFRRQGGKDGFLDITVTPLKNGEGERPGFLFLGIDITSKKNMEVQLLHSEKMASIGQLAAGVAHEINNPTGFVASNLNTLKEYCGDLAAVLRGCRRLLDEFRETEGRGGEAARKVGELWDERDIDHILEDLDKLVKESADGTDRIKKIVADLKDFSRSDKPEVETVNMNDTIDKTLTIVWNEIKYKAEVVKEYGDLPLISCMAGQLGQAFLNILVNAAQAIEKRGTITIKTYAKTTMKGPHIIIEFTDTGVGIPPEVHERIFDPFFTTKPVGKGTGLGLNITYHIIKQHGGDITVRSKPKEGSTFTISLPLNSGQQLHDEAGSEQTVTGGIES